MTESPEQGLLNRSVSQLENHLTRAGTVLQRSVPVETQRHHCRTNFQYRCSTKKSAKIKTIKRSQTLAFMNMNIFDCGICSEIQEKFF